MEFFVMQQSVKLKIKNLIKKIWRFPLRRKMTKQCKNCDKRILASNCIGGLLYHDINKPFTSPTINIVIREEDFIKLCEKPEHYLATEPVFEKTSPQGYPIANLDGILIYGVHYPDFETFKKQWIRRSNRFLKHTEQEIVVISCDAQIRSEENISRFHALPYRKICYTKRNDIPYKEFVHVPGFEKSEHVGDLTAYADWKGTRIFEKYFDCVKWLRNE